jgi:acyl-CoA thioesterase-1
MSKRFLLLIVLLLAAMPAAHSAPVILVFGDSLSAAYGIPLERGWVGLLQQRLLQQGYPHAVVNASVSGETTNSGLNRLGSALAAHHPVIVILELGANDGLRGLPVEGMRRNLAAMIEQCRRNKVRVLLLGMMVPPNYGPVYARQFRQTFPDITRQYRLPSPPFLLDGVAGNAELTQEDGLHPKAEAQSMLLENVWAALKPMLGKL